MDPHPLLYDPQADGIVAPWHAEVSPASLAGPAARVDVDGAPSFYVRVPPRGEQDETYLEHIFAGLIGEIGDYAMNAATGGMIDKATAHGFGKNVTDVDRVVGQAMAAYDNARANGASVSEALRAVEAVQGTFTFPATGEGTVADLVALHAQNEEDARAALSTPAGKQVAYDLGLTPAELNAHAGGTTLVQELLPSASALAAIASYRAPLAPSVLASIVQESARVATLHPHMPVNRAVLDGLVARSGSAASPSGLSTALGLAAIVAGGAIGVMLAPNRAALAGTIGAGAGLAGFLLLRPTS